MALVDARAMFNSARYVSAVVVEDSVGNCTCHAPLRTYWIGSDVLRPVYT